MCPMSTCRSVIGTDCFKGHMLKCHEDFLRFKLGDNGDSQVLKGLAEMYCWSLFTDDSEMSLDQHKRSSHTNDYQVVFAASS